MCGIIGCVGSENAAKVVIEGLKTLEYRGYDSWGVCIKDDDFELVKEIGKIGEVDSDSFTKSRIAIGHTRWATHGGVTKENAHPHLSSDGTICVVHNGIVENFQELRKQLVDDGFVFRSVTDSEVIPNLIQKFRNEGLDLSSATQKAVQQINGSFAIVVMDKNSNVIVGARRGSPLVVGNGGSEYFVASDVPAFLKYTKQVYFLDDDEMVVVNNGLQFLNLTDGEAVEKQCDTIAWDIEQAKKGDYPHFMIKELSEQEFTIKKAIEQDPVKLKKVLKMMEDSVGIFFVGCGTSYHACVSASYVFSHIAKKHVNVVLASEFRNYEEFLSDKTLLVAVSQSGETADLIDAVNVAKKHGVKVLAIVNVMGSTLMRMADECLLMNAGPEICVLSTKSYTSQLAILMTLAYGMGGKLHDGRTCIEKVCNGVGELIAENGSRLKGLAAQIKDQNDVFLIGRDLAYPSALEGALKIKEVSYIHAEGFAGGELKHGTIALIEDGVPCIVLVTDATRELILSNAMEIKARGAFIIGIDSKPNDLYDFFIDIHSDFGNGNPIAMIIPIQILAYYLALERGCDPDKPRNLAKSVTVK